jgi:hypothetical protein
MPRPSDGIREDRAAGRAGFWRCMLFILVAKALLEAFFFVGVVRQYGEEDLFVSLAMPSREPGGTYWDNISRFKNVHDWGKWTGDPSDMYAFRIAALYPNRMFTAVFGSSETSVMLWSAITGIGSVLLVGLIGRALAGGATGLLSAAIIALIPGHILYSARIDTDMPQLFFMSLGTFFLVLALTAATNRKQLVFAASCGLSFGFLYLAKLLPALLGLPWALSIPFLLAALGDRETLVTPKQRFRQAGAISLTILVGFALVFGVENLAYHHLSGHWFLHWRMMKGNAVNIESWRCGKFITFAFIKIWIPPGGWNDFFSHSIMFRDSLFPAGRLYSIYSAPIHGWSIVLFLPALLVLPFLPLRHRKLSVLLVLGFVCYYLYQEFFWFYPTVEDGKLNLTYVHKVHRFIFPCYIGISLCIGLVLGALADYGWRERQRWLGQIFRWAPVALVLAFGAANYPGLVFFHTLLRGSLADIRQACGDLRTIAPDRARIFIGAGSEPYYRLYQYPRHYELKYYVDDRQENVRNGWGVVGGATGIGVSPETFAEGYPEWLRSYYHEQVPPPPGWELVHSRPSPQDPYSHFVRILKLPQ